MWYFGDISVDGCRGLLRTATDENGKAVSPVERLTWKGWRPSPDAWEFITFGEYTSVAKEQVSLAMAEVLDGKLRRHEIQALIAVEGYPPPDWSLVGDGRPYQGKVVTDDSTEEVTPTGLDIVYLADNGSGCALFATKEIATLAAEKCRAVTGSGTWGEFRAAWPGDDFQESVEEHPDEDPFSRSEIPGLGEGFPEDPWPPDAVMDWFPADLIEKYEGEVGYTPEGVGLFLPSRHANAIAAELRRRGNNVEESLDDLPAWVAYWYGD